MEAGEFAPAQLTVFTAAPCERCALARACPARRTTRSCLDAPVDGLVDPLRDDFVDLLGELGGLDLMITRARPSEPVRLPAFVPQVDGTAVSRRIGAPWVLVNLGVLMRRAGFRQRRSQATLRERLGIPDTSRIALALFGKDKLLEQQVWPHRKQLLETIRAWKPDLVIAPDFSVWRDDPWLTQRVSIVRSLRLYSDLQRGGVAAIPHVYWGNRKDTEDWAAWIRANPVSAIAVDLQCIGLGLKEYARQLRVFRSLLPQPPHLFVNGVRPGRRMRLLQDVWPESSFSADLLRLAAKRRRLVYHENDAVSVRLVDGAEVSRLYEELAVSALNYASTPAGMAYAS